MKEDSDLKIKIKMKQAPVRRKTSAAFTFFLPKYQSITIYKVGVSDPYGARSNFFSQYESGSASLFITYFYTTPVTKQLSSKMCFFCKAKECKKNYSWSKFLTIFTGKKYLLTHFKKLKNMDHFLCSQVSFQKQKSYILFQIWLFFFEVSECF